MFDYSKAKKEAFLHTKLKKKRSPFYTMIFLNTYKNMFVMINKYICIRMNT